MPARRRGDDLPQLFLAPSEEGCIYISIWMSVGFWLGVAIYATAWVRGGHVERFAAMVWIVQCLVLVMNFWARAVAATVNRRNRKEARHPAVVTPHQPAKACAA